LESEVQVTAMSSAESMDTVEALLRRDPASESTSQHATLVIDQEKDPWIKEMLEYLKNGDLPDDQTRARKIATQGPLFAVIDGVLHYIDHKRSSRKRAIVPQLLEADIGGNTFWSLWRTLLRKSPL